MQSPPSATSRLASLKISNTDHLVANMALIAEAQASTSDSISSSAAVEAGFLYAVSRQNDLTAVKIGFTKSQDPWAYCQAYNRTMVPVHVHQLIPTCNAPLSEKLAHQLLKSHRVSLQHEVFDLHLHPEKLDACFEWVKAFDDMSEQPRPVLPDPKPKGRRGRKRETRPDPRRIRRKIKARLTEEDLEARIEAEERTKQDQRKLKAQEITSLVKDWLRSVLRQSSDNKDVVKLVELFHKFTEAHQSLQASRKTRRTARGFEEEVLRCLGKNAVGGKFSIRIGGERIQGGKCLKGYRFAS